MALSQKHGGWIALRRTNKLRCTAALAMILTMIIRALTALAILLIAAPALANDNKIIDREGQYWQRINAASAAYTYGTKAQQLLNHHIAFCTAELQTLQTLNDVKLPIARNPKGGYQSVKESEYYGWKRSDPQGVDLDNHGEYHNMEGCMLSHGWERVKHVPYSVASKARDSYKAAHYKTAIEQAKMDKRRATKSRRGKTGGKDRAHEPNENYND